ncbi:MAG: hypothetical protein AAB116_10975 [Candidatus Poribacteria bacterium]
MIPRTKLMIAITNEKKRQKEYRRRKKLPLIVFASTSIFHLIMAFVLSAVDVKMPISSFPFRTYDRNKSLDIVFLKEEDIPKIEIQEKFTPVVIAKSQTTVREKQKVIQKSVPQKVETKTAWESALLNNKNKGGQGSAGSLSGLKGTRGNPGDRPGMVSAGGIVNKDLITQKGGTGIKSEKIYDNMVIPAGTGSEFGAGGKGTSNFQFGVNDRGKGTGRADIAGRGGSGGTRGLGDSGPGQGLGNSGTGKGAGGKGTGIGLGDGSGTGGVGPGSGTGGSGTGTGTGSGKGGIGQGGPGSAGFDLNSPRGNPNLAVRTASGNDNIKVSPKKNPTIDEKRGAIGKEGFKAEIGKDMNSGKIATAEKANDRDYGDALQEEINRDLHSLRKLYEDWQNTKLLNIPKALQITVVLESGGPKVSSIDFHNASLSPKIKDDLTRRIKSWQFKSLSDGKDDPTSWPVKLNGRISWQ